MGASLGEAPITSVESSLGPGVLGLGATIGLVSWAHAREQPNLGLPLSSLLLALLLLALLIPPLDAFWRFFADGRGDP